MISWVFYANQASTQEIRLVPSKLAFVFLLA